MGLWQNPFSDGGEPAGSKAKREPARAGPFEEQRLKDERRLSLAIRRAFTRIGENIFKVLKKESKGTKALTDVPADFDLAEANREIFFEEIGDLPEQLMLEGGLQAQSLGLAVDFDLVNTQVLNSVATYKNSWWNELSFKTQENLRSAIATNISTGAPHRDLVKSLQPTFGKVRAEMIASTETTRLYAEGNRQGYAAAGIGFVEFQTVKDSAVDPDCEDLDGKVWSINQEDAIPPIHPRCRCWLAPITDEGQVLNTPQEAPTGKTPGDHITSEEGIGKGGGIHAKDTSVVNVEKGTLPKSDMWSDTRLVHKRVANEVGAEQAAFETFEMMEPGWAPTFYADKDGAGHMLRWVDEAGHGGTAKNFKSIEGFVSTISEAEARDLGRMSVLDTMMGNPDRHWGNFIRFNNRLIPIDNGFAFGEIDTLAFSNQMKTMKAVVAGPGKLGQLRASPAKLDAFEAGAEKALAMIEKRLDDLAEIWTNEAVNQFGFGSGFSIEEWKRKWEDAARQIRDMLGDLA